MAPKIGNLIYFFRLAPNAGSGGRLARVAHLSNELPDTPADPEIKLLIEELRVVQGLVGKKEPDWGEHISSQPHSPNGTHDPLFGELAAKIVEEEEDHEEYDRKYERHADAPLSDNRSKGSADKEHDQNGDGVGQLLMPCNLMLPQVVHFVVVGRH